VDKGGKPTFDKVMRGLRLLQKHGVDYNVLTTVNRVNGDYPLEVYRFLRDEVGTTWMQFIPVVERINADGLTIYQEGTTVSDRSVQRGAVRPLPERHLRRVGAPRRGYDLCADLRGGAEQLAGPGQLRHVRLQRHLRHGAGHRAQRRPLLVRPLCGAQLLAGQHPGQHMIELVASPQQIKFGLDKRDTLPRFCRECDVRFACHGECPKNRFILTPDGEPGLNYLCAGFKAFFTTWTSP
jgi:uncharacterized protein